MVDFFPWKLSTKTKRHPASPKVSKGLWLAKVVMLCPLQTLKDGKFAQSLWSLRRAVTSEYGLETMACNDLHPSSTMLRVTGLQNDKNAHTAQTQDVPSNLNFSSSISRYHDILMPPPSSTRRVGAPNRGATLLSNTEGLQGDQFVATQKSDTQDVGRRSSLTNSMNGDLAAMMLPEQITQGDTQTQGAFQRSVYEDAVTVTPSSLRAPSIQSSHLQTPSTTDRFPLRPDTQHHIASRKPYLMKTANALASKAGGRTESGQFVLCQCGYQKEEGDMV